MNERYYAGFLFTKINIRYHNIEQETTLCTMDHHYGNLK